MNRPQLEELRDRLVKMPKFDRGINWTACDWNGNERLEVYDMAANTLKYILDNTDAIISVLSAALAVEAGAEIDGGRFADWSTSMIAAECRAQSRDQLDPEFSRFMGEVAKRLYALTPASSDLSNAPVAFGLEAQGHIPTIETMLAEGADWQEIGLAILWDGDTAKSYYERYLARRTPASSAVEGEAVATLANDAQFLLDRLSELEWSDIPDDFWRDWNGHVEPAIARLRMALVSPAPQTEDLA